MSRICEICGKKGSIGNRVTRRGLAKKKGGIGLKTTGISSRQFKPNIQKVKASVNGKTRSIRVCISCLRSKVTKPTIL